MRLDHVLRASVEREPGALALVEGARRLSYAQWYAEIERVAGGLADLGVAAGDHVVAVASNRAEMASAYWACQRLGAIFTPFNWRASGPDVAYVLEDAEARVVVYEARSADAVLGCGFDPGRLVDVDGEGPGHGFAALAGPAPADPGGGSEASSLMLYTSGTTGRPKGVPRSHRAEHLASLGCIAHMRYRHAEISLGVMPLFHTMGIRALVMSTMLGGTFVAMPTFDAARAMALVASERVSALFLVPTMFHDIVNHPDVDRVDLSSVRNLGYAGMSMTGPLIAQCARRFRPEIFTNFYGSSEIYTFSVCNDVERKPGSAGLAGIGQSLRVVRAAPDGRVGPEETLACGEKGEIIASMRAPDAFEGYWKRPDADEKSIRDGWYFTGDLGRFDADGELHVLGRVDDMFISGGENVYPEEIEETLARCELVRGVAVIGRPDPRLGEVAVAYVEPATPAVTAAELDAYCLGSGLARFKRPRDYVFVESIPRSASGKLLRRHLRAGDYEALDDAVRS